MANILLTTVWTSGDVLPFVRIGHALTLRGHRVTLITHLYYEPIARSEGLEFAAVDTLDEFDRLIADGHLFNTPQGFPIFYRRHVLPKVEIEYQLIQRHHRPDETILVARWTPGIAARMAAEKLGVPLVSLLAAPSHITTTHLVDELFESMLSEDINRIRASAGLDAVRDWRAWLRLPRRYIGVWPDWFGDASGDAALPGVALTGFIQPEEHDAEPLPADVQALLDDEARPILITGGTSPLAGAEFFAASAQACRLLGRRGILVSRHASVVPKDLPPEVGWFERLPSLAKLMPHLGAIVHHGGMGTLTQALAAGVPQLVMAGGGDRPDNAIRLQNLGVAEFLPPSRYQPRAIAEALDRLIRSESVQARCAELARRVRATDSLAIACAAIESALTIDAQPVEVASTRVDKPSAPNLPEASLLDLQKKLSPKKLALLEKRLKAREKTGAQPQPIPRLSRDEMRVFPLSFAQQRLWFLDQLAPGSPFYNIPVAVRLSGTLDLRALDRGLNEIVQRHEALRTRFAQRDGQPIQIIAPELHLPLPVVDLLSLPETEREAEARRLAAETARLPFDLTSSPLLRVRLLRVLADEYVLLAAIHHIVSDGWSIGVFVQELAALYSAFAIGAQSALPELTVQYADFAAWQRGWLQGEMLAAQLDYWKQQLADAPARLDLPADRPRPAVQSFEGAWRPVELPATLSTALKTFSREQGVTLFMTLLAAFQAWLHRYSGQTDILVGTPIANRTRAETEKLIGFFVNTLVMRANLSGNPTFRDLLARVRDAALGAYAHQDLPFEKLVEELQPERSLNRSPLFQVMFQLENTSKDELRLPGLSLSSIEVDRGTSAFDLTLSLVDGEERLTGTLEYSTDLFDESTVARWLDHFQTLLEAIVANPDSRIADLPLMREAEQRRVIVDWNATQVDYPAACLHHLFEDWAARTPDAVALVYEQEQLRYAELNQRANQLAHRLRALGVGPDVRVGVYLERSHHAIVAILGVLKAGGAYVPLDPALPQSRIDFMLADSGARVVVTQQSLVARLAHASETICLDADWPAIPAPLRSGDRGFHSPFSILHSPVSPHNLAYVIYTSGSTGQPKGVAIEHRQIVNYVRGVIDRLNIQPGAGFATVSTLAADLGNTVVFPALATGGCLHVISHERIFKPDALADYFRHHVVDYLKIVPSHMAALLDAPHPADVLPRRMLILGGEASSSDWIAHLRSLAPACDIRNHYGPTETTVGVLTYRRADDRPGPATVTLPLGRPLPNSQVYILDAQLRPVPVGVAGELYIGGAGLARGYLNRPGLTAERFIPNPFLKDEGRGMKDEANGFVSSFIPHPSSFRLYKTGDLARFLPTGDVEFLGRTDDQVKVRGYRIELGEIEAALAKHPDLRDAAVLARADGDGSKQLVAYVVPQPRRAPMLSGKRRYRLPNNLSIAHLNKNETDYVYREIFDLQAYLRHGVMLHDGDCIFDVGANIGLFMLFADRACRRPKVYAFEPNPTVFDLLSANSLLVDGEVKVFNHGLSDSARSASFTFFPGFSLLSGLYGDPEQEKQVVKTFLLNQQTLGMADAGEFIAQADDVLAARFAPQTLNVPLKTLSRVIAEEHVDRIDLLKINVEKSELDVLNGIADDDWRKIEQIVLEVDVQGNLPSILALLDRHGYECAVEQDVVLANTPLCYVYAIRPSARRRLIREQAPGAHVRSLPASDGTPLSVGELKRFLNQHLPEHMLPSAFVFLDALPLTPNGKLDRRALSALDRSDGEAFVAPRTPVEDVLSAVWHEVLKLDGDRRAIGADDSFFDLGGHSLLAAQVFSRVRDAFHVDLPIRTLFEAPTLSGLAARIEGARHVAAGLPSLPIQPAPRDGTLPLSFAQQRLWFLDQLVLDTSFYNVPVVARMAGRLRVDALARSLSEIVRRHESLRTAFPTVEGHAVQRIASPQPINLPVLDLQDMPAADRTAAAQRLAFEEVARPFSLARGPLLRVSLLRLDEREHILLLTMHHIVSDGWSIGILIHEIAALYEAYLAGRESPLPELPMQYVDFAHWQQQWLQGEVLQRQLDYWRGQLADAATLQLPTDRPRPPAQTFVGATRSIELPPALTESIQALSRRENVTLFMTLLTGFQALLSRYSGQTDIVVGSPIANRSRVETEGLIGLFINNLALRADLSGRPNFCEALARVREMTLGAYTHQDIPFEKLVEELQPERNLSRQPLFQVMFVLQNTPQPAIQLSGLQLSPLEVSNGTAKFDLTVIVWEERGRIAGVLEYNTDLFDATTIDRLANHYRALLEGVVADPDRPLADVPLLSDEERRSILFEWNDTRRPYRREACLHTLFEEQAARTPNAIAVVCPTLDDESLPGQTLTYYDLNRQANQLAHHLKSLGIGPGDFVAVHLDRSIDMIPALLGILKSGAAYVPLEPSFPAARVEWILASLGVRCAIVHRAHLPTFAHLHSQLPELQHIVCADLGESIAALPEPVHLWTRVHLASLPDVNLPSQAEANDLAYVIFTSGSTGTPKGVMVQHRPVLNLIDWITRTFDVNASDRVLFVTSLCFDLSVYDIFGLLAVGGSIHVVPDRDLRDPERLLHILRTEPITFWDSAPAALQQLTPFFRNTINPDARLRLVFLSGDWIPVTLPDLVRNSFPRAQVIGLGGATEAAVWSNFYPIERVDPAWVSIPYGRPIQNARYHVLDERLEPCPIGVHGDLYIGGECLALGYANEPELTAEKFIPNPFTPPISPPSETGGDRGVGRIYKTGDRARYWPDGTIEFLGRIDHQVKVRGFRIELGEIETVLGQHPAVHDSVVIAAPVPGADSPRALRLIAYVVPRPEALPPTAVELRSFLQSRLPEYMLPSAFVRLDALPVTPNGKLDRRALPSPESIEGEREGKIAAARTPIEARLAEIWARVLGLEQVGIHDNFFELGGDSILSVQIIARAQEVGLRLTPRQLFQHQTIAELAAAAGALPSTQAEQSPVIGETPLSPIQHWFFEQDLPDRHHWNQAVMLSVPPELDAALVERAIDHLLLHHDALRLRFTQNARGWQATIAEPGGVAPFTRVDLATLPEPDRRVALETSAAEAQAGLDLARGPIVRAVFFDLGGVSNRLLIVIHHLAVDGVSWRVLLEDLQIAYRQLSQGESPRLPDKTVSFKAWAEHLDARAQSPALNDELAYWRDLPWSHAGRLPIDLAVGDNTEASAQTLSVALEPAETRSLLQDAPAAYRTQINDVLLTALARALTAWTNASAILVDLEGHGREVDALDLDVSRTIGWFTTIFPALIDREAAGGSAEALKSVKEQLRRVPSRGIGYGLLRHLSRDGAIARALRDLPQAEVSFNYLGQLDQVLPEASAFGVALESSGPVHSLRGARRYLLDVNAMVSGGRLHVTWTYSQNVHARETIERLAQTFLDALRALIAHCLSPEAGGYTPSDFPLARLDQLQLDALLRGDRRVEDVYPLSPMQQGMLFHTLYSPRSGAYFEQLHVRLRGRLDALAFRRAWERLIARHTGLRAGFAWEGLAQPVQIVRRSNAVQLPWTEADWRDAPPDEQAKRLDAFLVADRGRGFNLSQPPLMRLALFRLSDAVYAFVWSHHHLLLDGWSLPIVFQEVIAWYESFTQDRDVSMEAARPYRDYIAWLGRQDAAQAETYWRRTLSGFTRPTRLGIERAAPSVDAPIDYATESRELSAALTRGLQWLARERQLTLSTLMQGAWALLLSRYSGESDVVFGATVSGRPADLPGSESMPGLFINTLPMRVNASPQASVSPWLQAFQAQQADMRQYEYSPLSQVQAWSDAPRGQPLFENLFVFENYPLGEALPPGEDRLAIGGVQHHSRTNYPLTLVAGPGALVWLRLTYDSRRFDRPAIGRMLDHFQVLLEGIIADPERRLSALSILTEAERRRALVDWNTSGAEYPTTCFSQLFEVQVERTPDAPALIFAGAQFTYRELNHRANQLARRLRRSGVGAESLVAICMERSIEMVVSVLGILKASGAYLPLDPAYPVERLSFMLVDSGARVLLTQESLIERLPEYDGRIICVDTDWSEIAKEETGDLEIGVEPENAAYVIYTSGSTGLPKGTLVQQRSLVNYTTWAARTLFDARVQFLPLVTKLTFDASLKQLFGPLLCGRAVWVLPEEVAADPVRLLQAIGEREGVAFNCVPSLWQAMLEAARSGQAALPARSLVSLLLGGEALGQELVAATFEALPDVTLWNLYGPTELTSNASAARVVPGEPITIGRPIANVQTYVLDATMQPAPVGLPGELCVGGDGMARGYLNRPDLTAERFVPNPFLKDEGGGRKDEESDLLLSFTARFSSLILQPSSFCLYKTGDLARYLPDGRIEFLGRIDDQVKVRGFRIELGEVEATLAQHANVRETVVAAQPISPERDASPETERRLVAYVVPRRDPAPSIGELRDFLKAKLPDFMLPSAFVFLPALPLMPNGKVDRRALPLPDAARPDLGAAYVAPQTPIERALAEVWAESLGLERVGVHDNYFELGGDSIRSIQVLSRARARGLAFSLQQLFQHPTIHALARELETTEADVAIVGTIAPFDLIASADRRKLPEDVEDAYPLATLQAGMFFHSLYSPDSPIYHIVTSLRLKAPFDVDKLDMAIQGMAARHPILRTSFDLTRYTEPLQLVHRAVRIPFAFTDVSDRSEAEQDAIVSEQFDAEKRRKFDWTQPPLIRFHAHRRGADSFQLTWSQHHAILDGWSMAALLTELFRTYLAVLSDAPMLLPPPPSSAYRDFVALEREALTSETARAYWSQLLSDYTLTWLPEWPIASTPDSRRVQMHHVPLAPETLAGLQRLAQSIGVPLKNVFLAAHLRVLSLLSGQSDVMTGLVANGRPETPDGERLVGLFLNTIPLRAQLRGGSWIDLVRQTFDAERAMLPFRRYPLAELQKRAGGQPLFETVFNYVNFYVYQDAAQGRGDVALVEGMFHDETNFPLVANFITEPGSSRVQLRLDCDVTRLDETHIAALATYYTLALDAMATDPESNYRLHDLLPERERRQMLVDWNDTRADYPREGCLHEWFESQVEQTPDAIAIVSETDSLTYAELNRRANQLAYHLRALGVRPEGRVAICVDRSPMLAAGLLGILKAGGAYVPLDPAYPQERLAYMLTDSGAQVLLTQERLKANLPDRSAHVICLDTDWSSNLQLPISNLQLPAFPDNPAYVIYTSGSTGQPKGVVGLHRAALNRFGWMWSAYPFTPDDVCCQKTALSFVDSVWETFGPLLKGVPLVVIPDDVLRDIPAFVATLAARRITRLVLVPSLLRALLETYPDLGARLPDLRLCITSGEALPIDLAARFRVAMPACALLNLYGSSEVSADVTAFAASGHDVGFETLPIGRPIANSQVYVLNEAMQPVPIGVPGELYVGGANLARGYLDRPDLTAERFLPNPFSALRTPHSALRIYKTGDLARWLPGGELEFLGRIDHQVKVRGMRVELGEIETVLREHPLIRDAVAAVHADGSGENQLVGYIVPRPDATLTADDIRTFLKAKLPEHMLLSTAVFLDRLPLMPNGKVDRHGLPRPDLARSSPARQLIEPRDMIELRLARLWEQLLGVQPIGVRDDFFTLGGHSLAAMRLVARIQQEFDRTLGPSALFEGATIEQLAERLRRDETAATRSPLVKIQSGGEARPFFWVHPGDGHVLCYGPLARHLGSDRPLYGFQARGLEDDETPFDRFEDMAACYIEAMRAAQPEGPYFLGGWSMGGSVAFEMARQLHTQGQRVALLALLDAKGKPSHEAPDDDAAMLVRLVAAYNPPADLIDRLRPLSPDDQLHLVLAHGRQTGALPPGLRLEQLRSFLRMRRAHAQAIREYRPQPYAGRVIFFKAGDASADDFEPIAWDDLAAGVTTPVMPGNHFTMVAEPHVRALAERLRACIAEAETDATVSPVHH